METNYAKIKSIIDSGHIAHTVTEDGYNCLYSYINPSTNGIKNSGNWKDINHCENGYCEYEQPLSEINKEDFVSINVYNKPLRYPQVGDLVQILPTAKDAPGYKQYFTHSNYLGMIGSGPFEVKGINDLYCSVRCRDKDGAWDFDYRNITPRIEPIGPSEDDIQGAMDILEKAGKIKDGKIIIN